MLNFWIFLLKEKQFDGRNNKYWKYNYKINIYYYKWILINLIKITQMEIILNEVNGI